MRKLVGLFLIVLVLAALTAPAAAIPVTDLTALARYFDPETQIFGSIRTDDGYIETLEGVLARVLALVPEDRRTPTSLRAALDDLFANFPGANTFDEAVRPWLGDTAAIGVKHLNNLFDADPRNDNDIPFMVALASRDRAAAIEFFSRLYPYARYTVTDAGAYTLFTPTDDFGAPPSIYIDDQAVLLARGAELFPTGGPRTQSLATSADFTAAFAALPAQDYNIGLYLNIPALFDMLLTSLRTPNTPVSANTAALQGMISQIETSADFIGGQVWGFTILDGRSLTIDIAQSGDIAGLAARTLSSDLIFDRPADLGFLARIPAGAPAVILSSQFGSSLEDALDSLTDQAAALGAGTNADDLVQTLAQIEFAVQGLTGMDLEDEILSWMDGEYALYFTLSPALGDIRSINDVSRFEVLPADAALILETSNPDLSARLVTSLGRALTSLADDQIRVTTETIGGGSATVVTVPAPGVSYPVELLI
ncbi:MAG: DUF3352 domain-containing protein, partial [Anaerolinea sp.]|nr:DUF3352 domain-containing protein [Anaerolinea sp.]